MQTKIDLTEAISKFSVETGQWSARHAATGGAVVHESDAATTKWST